MTANSSIKRKQGQQQALPEEMREYRERALRTQKINATYFTIVPKANSTLSRSILVTNDNLHYSFEM